MYPFERFSEDAKKTLMLAQEEAERAHHSYIGTEHLLLGLLRLDAGPAPTVLRGLKIDAQTVRKTIEAVLGRNERILIQQIVPTSRVRMVIEIAFEESRRMHHQSVNSGHLLIALVMEGEGIAAHVLEDLGADARVVVAAVERELGVKPSGRGKLPQTRRLFNLPGQAAGAPRVIEHAPAQTGSDIEQLHRLLKTPEIERLLKARGLDVDALAGQLARAPEAVLDLRRQAATARAELSSAVAYGRYDVAAKLQKREIEITKKLRKVEQDWLDKLTS